MIKTIYADCKTVLALGKQGENNAVQVIFKLAAWREMYGNGSVALLIQRKGDPAPYAVPVTIDGDMAVWTISNTDNAVAGYGNAELQYFVGDVLAKSATWRIYTEKALGDASEDVPEPWKSYTEQVLAAGQEVEAARQEWASMAANAETLDPDEEATASYSGGVLSLGIPRGERGEKGDAGALASVTATVDGTTGTPSVTVSYDGENAAFAFSGLKGERGERGERGEQGIQGLQGERGQQGLQGIQGLQGVRGERGETGPAGPRGETGPQGPQGIPGESGASNWSDVSGKPFESIGDGLSVSGGVLSASGGGGGADLAWKKIATVNASSAANEYVLTVDSSGNPFAYKEIEITFTPQLSGYFYVRADSLYTKSGNVQFWVTNGKETHITLGLFDGKLALSSVCRADGAVGYTGSGSGNTAFDSVSYLLFGASAGFTAAQNINIFGR